MVKSLLPYIEAALPARAEKEGRLLFGFSKSGWGAFTLLLRNPEVFGYAAAWDTPFMFDGTDADWGKIGISKNFGMRENFQKSLPSKLVLENADYLKKRARLVLAPGDGWKRETIAMHDLLDQQSIPQIYRADLLFPHRWDSGWFSPLMDELIRLSRDTLGKD